MLRRLTPGSRRGALAAIACGVFLVALSPRLYAQMRFAVVDMQRAIVETEQGRHAKNQLRVLFQKRQVELDARAQALKELRDGIEHDRGHADADSIRRRSEQYQQQFVALQQNYLDYQQELSEREAQLTKQIYANLKEIVRQIGQQQGFAAILEQGEVLWSPANLDLTDQVVQVYNQQYPYDPDAGTPAAGATDAGPTMPLRTPLAGPHPRGGP